MNIRSVTLGINWKNQNQLDLSEYINKFMKVSRDRYNKKGYKIRTCRLSMSPINEYSKFSQASSRSIIDWISNLCDQVGIRWFCVPFTLIDADNPKKLIDTASEIISRNSNAFINMIVARNGIISDLAVKESSRLIRNISKISNNGFDNFRVGISCNIEPHTPYFPFAYHAGSDGFSLALEIVDELLEIAEKNVGNGLDSVRVCMLEYLIKNLRDIDTIGKNIESETGIKFLGLDASLAPFPNGDTSVAKLVEVLGVEDFGSNGSLFITSYLTDIIKTSLAKSGVRYVGFNGVMYSLLEDDYLALRNKQKNFTLDSLMLYSAVCGCGIDMVPVPGDILDEEVSAIIFDIAALAATLNKPLGVRILPVTGKSSNELTNFNYDFLVDTRIMPVRNRVFSSVFKSSDRFIYLKKGN